MGLDFKLPERKFTHMDIMNQMKTGELFVKLIMGDNQNIGAYEYQPQKSLYMPKDAGSNPLPVSYPEAQGIRSAHIEAFFKELDAAKDINVHSVVLARHGSIIASGHFKPYRGDYAHMTYSLSKSILSTAVGMAIDEGYFTLDDKLVDIFPDKTPPYRSGKIASITVRHLLTMSTGVRFNETGSVIEKDWVRGYLQSEAVFTPGTQFFYNSMNSYMLAAVIKQKTGMGLVEFLTPRLFEPLGIEGVTWEKCPMGIEKGGWGLNLRPVDMAKIGQLYLQKGSYVVGGKKKQLLSRAWVEQATSKHIWTQDGECVDGYGFCIWMCSIKGAYQFNGAFGQYVVVLPKQDMVIAITSGSQNLFPQSAATEIVKKYFGNQVNFSAKPLPRDMQALRSLRETLDSLYLIKETKPTRRLMSRQSFLTRVFGSPQLQAPVRVRLPIAAKTVEGRNYRLEKSVGGILPLIQQGIHMNFSAGLTSVRFRFHENELTADFTEGEDSFAVVAGLDGEPRYSDITIKGENYRVGSTAKWTVEEDNPDVLKLFISFIETPNTRVLKFSFANDTVRVEFDESPSVRAATVMLFELIGGKGNAFDRIVKEAIHRESLKDIAQRILEPKTSGKTTDE